MDPRALLRPVGPLPATVYWRRRSVLLGAVVIVAVLLGSLTGGGSDRAGASPHQAGTHRTGAAPGHAAAGKGAAGKGAARPVPHATTSVDAPVIRPARPCAARQVRLAVTADHARYPAGVLPRFVLTVTGAGTVACTVDVGPAARSFLVRSGEDRIWSSADCARGGHQTVTLRPHQRLAYAITWSRHRSAPGCPSSAAVAALPGTYRVMGKVGSLTSANAVLVLAAA